ncbi:restriction endonuclease subunit S [Priestia megaterium]|uniref:restriction endonuclease subunit S n=1 Tax=Priestia megaterium TaxID=1404 RepID=UPI00207A67A8|nr:restriction endonuclease subunit S [Priestia megaterium]USL33996.1 restriction endonuclease subunit S [Priestia megaterium]
MIGNGLPLYQWFGIIPPNWEYKKMKFLTKLRSEKAEGKPNLPYIGLENIQSKTGIYLKPSSENIQEIEGTSNKFYKNDVLFGKLRPYLGKCILADFEGICTTELLVLKVKEQELSEKYLKYLLISPKFIDLVNSSTYGSKMPRANWEFIKNIEVPLPSLEIQKRIELFIENKTEEIDTLIGLKETLIKLVEKKRQSIITEAVTKGLNLNVKMKDSGMEWIGEIPEHWVTTKAKYIFKEKSVKGYPKKRLLSVSKGRGVIPRDEMEFKVVMAFKDLQNFKLVQAEDFVIHLRSFQSGFEISEIEGIVSPAYTIFSLQNKGIASYYKYLFYSKAFIDAIASTTQSLRDGKPIAYSDFGNMEIPVPSLKEQTEIAQYIEDNLKNIDVLVEEIALAIEKLKEYRQSLIYEAVTGKIDVHEFETA